MKRTIHFQQQVKNLRGDYMRETMSAPVTNSDGTVTPGETVEMTLKHCCIEALNLPPEKGQTPSAKETVRKGKLMWKIYDAEEPIEIDHREADLLKDQLHKRYPVPLVYTQLVEMIDPDDETIKADA